MAVYGDRRQVLVGDVASGWLDAAATVEVTGTVVAAHEGAVSGANCVLAALELEELAEGEPAPRTPGDGVCFAPGFDPRQRVVRVRAVECHADRLRLVHRRQGGGVAGGVLLAADPLARLERERRAGHPADPHDKAPAPAPAPEQPTAKKADRK